MSGAIKAGHLPGTCPLGYYSVFNKEEGKEGLLRRIKNKRKQRR